MKQIYYMAFYYFKMEVIKYNPFTMITMPNTRSQSNTRSNTNTRSKLNTYSRSLSRSFGRSQPKPKPALTPSNKKKDIFYANVLKLI